MTISRYSFGLIPGGFIAFVNVLTCVGWSMVNTMAGAEVFYSLTDTKLPLAICILILAIASFVVSFLGYHVIHFYERYSWLVMYPFFAILAGFGASHMQNLPMATGKEEMANVLSFGATVLGYAITWGPFSADYSVYMKEDISVKRLFSWTYGCTFLLNYLIVALISAQMLIMWLGAAFMTCAANNQEFTDAFNTAGAGGLMNQAFQGHGAGVNGFGKFVQFVLVLSTVAVTIPNLYSMGLSMQNVGMWAVKVPRFVWTTIGFIIFTVAGIVGRDHFATILTNFLNCLAYW
jgi:purine-cytosine permease-like protein